MPILTETETWRRGSQPRPGTLTAEQAANVRRAIDALAVSFETPMALAKVLGVTLSAMWKYRDRNRKVSARLALVVAGAAGVAVDDVLAGRWPGDVCIHCGGTGRSK
jgi:hypothetical protein